ncbi:MAG TPA: hypothetical protein VFH68_12965 [Polyangia bacterium]|jgi:hypothetical protein|nr:hypothetical protein [Polyangia bacterium]
MAAARLIVGVLAGAAAGSGCKSSPTIDRGDADADGAIENDGSGGGDTPDGGCNGLTQLGAPVTPTCDPGSAPAAAGGLIVDGTYVLTESHFYGGCSTVPLLETLVIAQGTVQSLATGADATEIRASVSYQLGGNGTTLAQNQTCPAKVQTAVRFSATPTTLTIYLSTLLATRVSTFTLQ